MKKIIRIILFALVTGQAFSQQIFDEMQLVDISAEAGIRSTVIRDPAQALLIIQTQISSLRIQSNNIIHKIDQPQPGTWHVRLAPGTHRISFQAEGFVSIQQRFYFSPKEVKGLQIRVIPVAERKEERNVGYVVIQSKPDSIPVYFNEQFYGITPYMGKIIAGRYKLELKREPYRSFKKDIVIVPGQTLPVDAVLYVVVGSATVTSKPADAKIILDGNNVGKTPMNLNDIPVGKHVIKLELENYDSYTTEFEITEEKSTERIYGKLNKLQSRLAIQGSPTNSTIEINGTKVGTLPLKERSIEFGSHDITISKPGFYTYNKFLLVNKSDLYTLSIKLSPKSRTSATLYSTILPGSGQIYSGRSTPGILLGAASLGGLAVTFALNSSYQDKRNQYLDNKQAYEDNTDPDRMTDLYSAMLSSYDDMESTYNSARIAGILTAVVWVYNIVDTYIFFPKQSGVQLSVYSDDDRVLLSLYLTL